MPKYPVPFIMPGVDVADADAAVGDVLNPRTFYSVAPPRKTGVMPTVTLDPALNAYPAGYHAGAASLTAMEAELIPENILLGATIFGVGGTVVPIVEIDMPSIMGALSIASTPDFESFVKPCAAGSSHAEAEVGVDQSHNKNAPIASSYSTSVA